MRSVCACGVDSNPHCRLPNESCWDGARLGGVYVRCPYMLGAEAPSNDNWWNELQRAPANDLRDWDRGQVTVQIGLDRRVLEEHLASLDDAGGQLAPALHLGQVGVGHSTFAQRGAQDVGRGHRIGHSEVDADSTGR